MKNMYFIKTIIFMCHITNWATVWSSPKQSAESGFTLNFPTSKETILVELQHFQKVKDWLDLVKHNQLLPNHCGGKEVEIVTADDLLMRNGPCHENGAIKKLEFLFVNSCYSLINFKIRSTFLVIFSTGIYSMAN